MGILNPCSALERDMALDKLLNVSEQVSLSVKWR